MKSVFALNSSLHANLWQKTFTITVNTIHGFYKMFVFQNNEKHLSATCFDNNISAKENTISYESYHTNSHLRVPLKQRPTCRTCTTILKFTSIWYNHKKDWIYNFPGKPVVLFWNFGMPLWVIDNACANPQGSENPFSKWRSRQCYDK